MPELKNFPVFGESGRIGTLSAPARFLDSRSQKTIQLDGGGEILVAADALKVQPDGSFRLYGPALNAIPKESPQPSRPVEKKEAAPVPEQANNAGSEQNERLYREGYVIEHVQINKLITEPVFQQQVGDTLILPVVEEVLVTEKRMILREEIRITRSRDAIAEVPSSLLAQPNSVTG